MPLTPELEADLPSLKQTLADFTAAKVALTALLTDIVNKFNANAPKADQAAALTAYVNGFNAVTAASNALRTAQTKAIADMVALGNAAPMLQNFTDDQMINVLSNPQGFWATSTVILANLTMLAMPDEASMYAQVDLLSADLKDAIHKSVSGAPIDPVTHGIPMVEVSLGNIEKAQSDLLNYMNELIAKKAAAQP